MGGCRPSIPSNQSLETVQYLGHVKYAPSFRRRGGAAGCNSLSAQRCAKVHHHHRPPLAERPKPMRRLLPPLPVGTAAYETARN